MVRWVVFSVTVVIITAIATVASTYLTSESPEKELIPARSSEEPAGPPGSASLDGPESFDFATMSQEAEGKKVWTISNEGPGIVKLSKGKTTCSCTIANLAEGETATLEPGKSTKVTLTWNTRKNNGSYRQSATILVSNDPQRQQFELTVKGTVRPAIMTSPPDTTIYYQTVSNDSAHPREVAIFSPDRPDTKFTSATATNTEIVDAKLVPLTADECQLVKIEKGVKLVLNLKPNAPLGPFHEEVVVATDHPKSPGVRFTVVGKLAGPITVTPDSVRLLDVSTKVGDEQTLVLWVRGRKDTKFTIKQPEGFDVQVKPMTDVASTGNGMRYQVTVKVPPGMKSGSRVDEILIKTDHPQAPEIKIPVTVLVRGS